MEHNLQNSRVKAGRTIIAALGMIGIAILPISGVQAQQPRHKPNIIQRHPTATGVVTGVAVHHHLKKSAAKAKRSGRKLSFAQRHPTLTGAAAGLGTHHIVKHSRRP